MLAVCQANNAESFMLCQVGLKADSPFSTGSLWHRLALYDLIFGMLTNMAYMISSGNCKLEQIFMEKVPSTDQNLISMELIAYLKWLICVAAYEDDSTLPKEEFYQKQVLLF
jgi:hypothetical protein